MAPRDEPQPLELEFPVDFPRRELGVEVEREGKTVRRVPLVTLGEVEGASFPRKVVRTLGTLLIVAIVLGILFLVTAAVRRKRGKG